MAAGENCGNCALWHKNGPPHRWVEPDELRSDGSVRHVGCARIDENSRQCRRNPVPVWKDQEDWCGEWRGEVPEPINPVPGGSQKPKAEKP